ncbi:heterokaryon incompatibility protein-domain-containing protein, partial [Cadophora sp. MPI-SDFR-AT-0126]
SPETLDLMISWFSNCVENHPECSWSPGDSEVDPILPFRVIDIGDGSSPEFVPRLLKSGKQRGKWATLSHRWGQVDILKLLTGNVDKLEAGINVSELPATFQDAIFLTQHLGLRYLWIDSLCIIQDSPQDWLKEAASMPNIYRNAHITIAAAATENSTGGIFNSRSWVSTSRPCKLPVQINSTTDHGMVHFDIPFDSNFRGLETNYLRTRAWCIQESLLSHRLLTFDTLQMSYTCVREGLIESREMPPILAREERNKFLEQFQDGASTLHPSDSDSLRRMIISWYDIVYDYTRRDLTFSNDKLVAIAGIASIVGTCIQDEYYAGLWKHDMPRALLWSPYEEETLPNAPHKSSLPPIYRAPSWSWASIDSPISCFLCRERLPNPPIAEVLNMSTTLVGQDVYGQVSAGTLTIRGPL